MFVELLIYRYTQFPQDIIEIINSYIEKLYLYCLSHKLKITPNSFSNFVVVSSSAKEARLIHPSKIEKAYWSTNWQKWVKKDMEESNTWRVSPDKVVVKLIGEIYGNYKPGQIICSSYHNGNYFCV